LKPFLEQKAFKQKQRGIGSFSFFGFSGFVIFKKKGLNRLPIDGVVNLTKE